jgi:hypothetical protein
MSIGSCEVLTAIAASLPPSAARALRNTADSGRCRAPAHASGQDELEEYHADGVDRLMAVEALVHLIRRTFKMFDKRASSSNLC